MLARITVALLLLSGCGEEEPGCDGADCTSQQIVDQWDRAPSAARQALLDLSDPIVQLAVVRALAAAHPDALAELCPELSGETERECRQMSQRPHLWKQSNSKKLGSLPTDGVKNPWAALSAVEVGCADDSCRLTAASRAGAQGDGPGICASITEQRWRDECFFRVGEQSSDIALGMSICLGAGPYIERCLGHISRNLATPPLALNDAEGWKKHQESIQNTTKALPAPLAQRMVDRLWAESLTAAYNASKQATGDPLDHLPPSARPHILSAIAWRLTSTETHSGLVEWMAALDAALARRGTIHAPQMRPGIIKRGWMKVLPGEEALSWVAYLRDQRRVLGQSDEAERIICLLEGMHRSDTLDQRLLEDASTHSEREVRWTVSRIAKGNAERTSLNEVLQQDSDPLVVQRAPSRKMR